MKKVVCLNIKTALELLEIIDRQNMLIAELVNENLEQEAIIKNLMDVQLTELAFTAQE